MSDLQRFEPHEYLWRQHPDSGELVPPIRQDQFLNWLVTPKVLRHPPTQVEYSKLHKIPVEKLSEWKRDQRFQMELWRRAQRVLNPETVVEIVNYFAAVALDEDQPHHTRFKFAKAYVDLAAQIGYGAGPKNEVNNTWVQIFNGQARPADQLSDEELVRELQAHGVIDVEVVEDASVQVSDDRKAE